MDALLLDFNGVIVDDEPLHFESFRAILADEGIGLDRATYDADYLGLNDRAAFHEAFRRHGHPVEPAQVRRLIARKSSGYAALAERDLPVVAGAAAFVRAAAAGAHLAVVSGALRGEIQAGLVHAGIADLIDVIVSADDVPTTKPDPGGFRLALRQLRSRHGAGPWRAVVMEDSFPGLEAARALGAGCVMFTTSHGAQHLAGADLVWTSFDGHAPGELAGVWRTVEVA